MKRNLSDFLPEVHPVVMLCRNSLFLTKAAVDSVLKQDIPVNLHIVDNYSTDGTREWALELDNTQVSVTTYVPALGVSAGWNAAITGAFRRYDHCLVVNNDVVLRPDTYRELLVDGGAFVTAVSVSEIEGINRLFVKSVRPHPDFSCFLIRREVWEKVGLFDESMKLYASDCDYHVRMHQAGIAAYTIGIPFFHYASGTLKTASAFECQYIHQQADKDRERFAEKWGCHIGSPEYYGMFGHGQP